MTSREFVEEFLSFYYDCTKLSKSELNSALDSLAEDAISVIDSND